MGFHKPKPETVKRNSERRARERAASRRELRRRLAEKAAADPEGKSGIWAEMLREHVRRMR